MRILNVIAALTDVGADASVGPTTPEGHITVNIGVGDGNTLYKITPAVEKEAA